MWVHVVVLGLLLSPMPEPGQRQVFPFPADQAPSLNSTVPELTVVRRTPEGTARTVDTVLVTFNQPMLALATAEALAGTEVPLVIFPRVPGTFAWLTADTAVFTATTKFPMGQTFRVTVPAGTKAKSGQALKQDVVWEFTTAPPRVVWATPEDGQHDVATRPTLRLVFDGPVEAGWVLRHTRLLDKNGRSIRLKLAPGQATAPSKPDETEAFYCRMYKSDPVALQPAVALKQGQKYTLVIGSDTGKRADKNATTSGSGRQAASRPSETVFTVRASMGVTSIFCDTVNKTKKCAEGRAIRIFFTHKPAVQDVARYITVTPPVADLTFSHYDHGIYLNGSFLAGNSYKVRVNKGITSVDGEVDTKGAVQRFEFVPAPIWPSLSLPGYQTLLLEDAFDPVLVMTTSGLDQVNLEWSPVNPENLFNAIYGVGHPKVEAYQADPLGSFHVGVESKQVFAIPQLEEQRTLTPLPLMGALSGRKHGMAVVKATGLPIKAAQEPDRKEDVRLVVVTNLALTVVHSPTETLAQVTGLDDALPRAGAKVQWLEGPDEEELHSGKVSGAGRELASGITDERGVVRLPGPIVAGARPGRQLALVATLGDDTTLLFPYPSEYEFDTCYEDVPEWKMPWTEGLLVTDRRLFRPGETMQAHAILRTAQPGPNGDLELPDPKESPCTYAVSGPGGTLIGNGSLVLSDFGSASFSQPLPADAALGYYDVKVTCEKGSVDASFRVEEYRPAEGVATARFLAKSEVPQVGQTVEVVTHGQLYVGVPMAGAKVRWRARTLDSWYTPPNHDGFSFSQATPYDPHRVERRPPPANRKLLAEGRGVTDSNGDLVIPLTLEPASSQGRPQHVQFEADLSEGNALSLVASASMVAHPSAQYVGLRLDREATQVDQPVEASAVVTEPDGTPVEGASVTLTLVRSDWLCEPSSGEVNPGQFCWVYQAEPVASCTVVTGQVPGSCKLSPSASGEHLVVATTTDKEGRSIKASTHLEVTGKAPEAWRMQAKELTLTPDRESYEPGQTARILVRSPYVDATGLAVVGRQGIAGVFPFVVSGGTGIVEIPIEDRHIPEVGLNVVVLKGRSGPPLEEGGDPEAPAWISESATLAVSEQSHRLTVELHPDRAVVPPGGTFNVTIRTLDARQNPVSASVVLAVVDEGVLSLIGFRLPDPLARMFTPRAEEIRLSEPGDLLVEQWHPTILSAMKSGNVGQKSRARSASSILLGSGAAESWRGYVGRDDAELETLKTSPQNADYRANVRRSFQTTAYFNGGLVTAADGTLTVPVTLPDNLTEYRIFAVAADKGTLFGAAETRIRTRIPLMLRHRLPRFLNVGDQFQAAVLVTNLTGAAARVQVSCSARNLTVQGQAQVIELPPGESGEVLFPAATHAEGSAEIQFRAETSDDRFRDALQVAIPVHLPGTAEAVAQSGTVEESLKLSIEAPGEVLGDRGGLEVTLTSSALVGLGDAFGYLADYPYECTEQLASRLVATVLSKQLPPGLQGKEQGAAGGDDTKASQLVARLLERQADSGGFGLWSRDRPSLHVTAYTLLVLSLAKEAGIAIPKAAVEVATGFLRVRLTAPEDWEANAHDAQALAVFALVRAGDSGPSVVNHLRRLTQEALSEGAGTPLNRGLPLYATAWLLEAHQLVQSDADTRNRLVQRLANAATETAAAAHIRESAWEGSGLMMHSSQRTDAVVLAALLSAAPHHPLLPKLVAGVLASRRNGRWDTTSSNAFALMALSRYYQAKEQVEPNFSVSVRFADATVLEKSFQGQTDMTAAATLPMQHLVQHPGAELVVQKEGPGTLYYRLGMAYVRTRLPAEPLDRGFRVSRSYLAQDGITPLAPDSTGAVRVPLGSYVWVRLRVIAPHQRYYVAITNPLPAGFETVDTSLSTGIAARLLPSLRDTALAYWTFWDHTQYRDDRTDLFKDQMPGGEFEHTYLVKATTAGRFVVAPMQVQEMYTPETMGRTAAEVVVVQ